MTTETAGTTTKAEGCITADMDRREWYRTIGRCAAATGLHPCQLVTTWHAVEEYCDRRRGEGASAYSVAAELWPR
jgi:hypothetical protein